MMIVTTENDKITLDGEGGLLIKDPETLGAAIHLKNLNGAEEHKTVVVKNFHIIIPSNNSSYEHANIFLNSTDFLLKTFLLAYKLEKKYYIFKLKTKMLFYKIKYMFK